MTLLNRILYIISWFTIVSSLIIVSVVSYWLLYPYKTIEFDSPYTVTNENKTVKKGDRLHYLVSGCKYTDISPDLLKYFIDGVVYELPHGFGAIEKGCGITISDTYVPRAIPSGAYHMKIIIRYKVNPIRTIEIVNYSDEFTVVD